MVRNALLLAALTALFLSATPARADEDPRRAARRTPVVEVFERSKDAVVNISTTRTVPMRGGMLDDLFELPLRPRGRQVQSVGSGVIIHEQGYVVTNAHVVSRASDISVTFADGRSEPAQFVSVDPEHDLAVLRVDSSAALPTVRLGRSDDLMVGETVIAIGNPLGLQHTVTAGIISAVGRDLPIAEDLVYRGLIQTDTPINPGNSGGPLLNVNAALIGINTAIRGDAQNIGFAIPVDRVWELLPALLDLNPSQRVRFGLRVSGHDARVLEVDRDTPAAAADIRPNDRVVRFNGRNVRDGIDYYALLRQTEPGAKVKLTLSRGGRQIDADVTLEKIPPPDGAALAERLLGLRLAEITPEQRRRLGWRQEAGLSVVGVAPGSPADQARIQRGDLIVRLGPMTVTELADVGILLETAQPGQRVQIQGVTPEGDWLYIWNRALTVRR
jgi:serine protease Do